MRLRILHKCDQSKDTWTVRKLEELFHGKELTFENAVQRGYVWDNEKQSEFIMSIILENPIPPIYVAKNENQPYSAIDGKQRSLTLIKYMNDEFVINGLEPFELEDEEGNIVDKDINGMHFSELDEVFQNAIKDAALSIVILHNPTDDQICEYFYLLNNGKALNAITKTRVRAKSRKVISALGAHKLFKDTLTAKAFERFTNEDIVVKSWAILHEDEPSLETKVIRPLMEKVELANEDRIQLQRCFDRIYDVHKLIEDKKVAKRIVTRTHMISLMRIVNESIEQNLTTRQFEAWFVTFFAGKKSATVSSIYNAAAGAGSARKEAVCKRLSELDKSFSEYCKSIQRVA